MNHLPILIIGKNLTQPIDEYKVNALHVEVAKTYNRRGRELTLSDNVWYVVRRTDKKLYEKARTYFEVTPDQIDTEYYFSN